MTRPSSQIPQMPPIPQMPLVSLAAADPTRVAIKMPDGVLTYGQLRSRVTDVEQSVARALALTDAAVAAPACAAAITGSDRLPDHPIVAVPALPLTSTVIGLLGALAAGATVVPVNTGSGPDELRHVIDDSAPRAMVAPDDLELPEPLMALPRVWASGETQMDVDGAHPVEPGGDAGAADAGIAADAAALVVYTSGTTGAPKGVVISHGALAADLDALTRAWGLSADDVLVHALPLFHVHGLVLATLGLLRVGGTVRHLGRFDAAAVARQLGTDATVHYGVPTMYHRLADAIDAEPSLAGLVGGARLLVSGSAGLAAHDRNRITGATGLPVLERYGMTETLITCAATTAGAGEPGSVGPPLPDTQLQLVDDDGMVIASDDHDTVGEIHVRGATLFDGYLGRPEATAACFTPDGWFRTGDLATWSPTGAVRISGRRSVDLIKSGGYRIGAGEVENVLLGHPSVAEVAVTGEPDPDLGERIVAWVVPVTDSAPSTEELIDHVGAHLAKHKRPREVRFVDGLPRNEMGKVLKRALGER